MGKKAAKGHLTFTEKSKYFVKLIQEMNYIREERSNSNNGRPPNKLPGNVYKKRRSVMTISIRT